MPPIGPITPGSYVNVTPDAGPIALYPLLQAPSPTMPVTASDIQSLTLAALNIQEALREKLPEHISNSHVETGTDPSAWTQWAATGTSGVWYPIASSIWYDNDFSANDRVLVRLQAHAKTNSALGLIRLKAGVVGGSFSELPGIVGAARVLVTTTLAPVFLETLFHPTSDDDWQVQIEGFTQSGDTLSLYGPAQLVLDIKRANT